ncbi:hypothetical protein A2810_01750 [candidate division Kazan bacterium RIFCSPHIGHO2_01_FULL_49_10]|uniref:Uncharacterized protein n=1 Tax=candidate division Kazan bacterium RIFCSPLOWO2_01_FULL_48_13 TaxID=1798539 RepID=A0A1F4PN88_UNCK3|nr:MAG: hypothetical protein A2810_01750 [candidate division Kazan bacterium RIFCSPHIGHO2_01_FULL_49_10]OGB85070.1 MAG: hypothetical protein A2994_00470 [candidate division Kazan bacterium RIFCSPLOWO2_01_FULL_48_13]
MKNLENFPSVEPPSPPSGDGGVRSGTEPSYEETGAGIEMGLNLIYGELLPLVEQRAGIEVAQEIREMVVPYVKEFQTDEPIRILIALEEQAAANTLNTDIAGEFFHAMKEGLTTHPAWQQHYGQDSAQLADKRVKGLIARSKFEVTAEDGNHRPYAVTDLARYEHDLNRAA